MIKKLNTKKGFTLAELLVVVAIIAVLVAVSIPIFTTQLKKARYATNQANLRSAKAAAVAYYLSDANQTAFDGTYTVSSGKLVTTTSSNKSGTITDDDVTKAYATTGLKISDTATYTTITVYVTADGVVTYTGA